MYDTLTPSSHFLDVLQLFSFGILVQYHRKFLLLEKEVTSTTRMLKNWPGHCRSQRLVGADLYCDPPFVADRSDHQVPF